GTKPSPAATAATCVPSGESATSTGTVPKKGRFTITLPLLDITVSTLMTASEPQSPPPWSPPSSQLPGNPASMFRSFPQMHPPLPPPPYEPPTGSPVAVTVVIDSVEAAWWTARRVPAGPATVRQATWGRNVGLGEGSWSRREIEPLASR